MENTSQVSTPFAFQWTGADVDHLNAPELNSPQPCTHGAGCTYFGCCRFVHPGEEGTDRVEFDMRNVMGEDGKLRTQQACVRLVGNPGFYKRCRARMSWPEWCARNSIPYTPNPPRARAEATEEAPPLGGAAAVSSPPPSGGASRGRGGASRGRGGRGGRGASRGGGSGSSFPPL